MEYNKRQFQKANDKKVLHKVKGRWIVVSMALLMALGGKAAVTHAAHTSTDSANNGSVTNQDGIKERLNDNLVHEQHQSAVSQNSTNSATAASQTSSSSTISQMTSSQVSRTVTSQASNLHRNILLNANRDNSNNSSSSSSGYSTASSSNSERTAGSSYQAAPDYHVSASSSSVQTEQIGGTVIGADNAATSRNRYSIRVQYIDNVDGDNRVWEPYAPIKYIPGTPFGSSTWGPQRGLPAGVFALKQYTQDRMPYGYKFNSKGGPNHNGLANVPTKFTYKPQVMQVYVEPIHKVTTNGQIVVHYIDHNTNEQVKRSGQEPNNAPVGSKFDVGQYLQNIPGGYRLWQPDKPSSNLSARLYSDASHQVQNKAISIPSVFPNGTDNVFVQVVPINGENPKPKQPVQKPAQIYAHYIDVATNSDVTPSQYKQNGQPILDLSKVSVNTPVIIMSDNVNPNYHLDIPQGYNLKPDQQISKTVETTPQSVDIYVQGQFVSDIFTLKCFEKIPGMKVMPEVDHQEHIRGKIGSTTYFTPSDYIPSGGFVVDPSDKADNHKVGVKIQSDQQLSPQSAKFVYDKIPSKQQGTINISYVDSDAQPSFPSDTTHVVRKLVGTPFDIHNFDSTDFTKSELPANTRFEDIFKGSNVNQFSGTPQNVVIQVRKVPQNLSMKVFYRDPSDASDYQSHYMGSITGLSGQSVASDVEPYTNKLPQGYHYIGPDSASSSTFNDGGAVILDISRDERNITVNYVDQNDKQIGASDTSTGKNGSPFNVNNYTDYNSPKWAFDKIVQGQNVKTYGPQANQKVTIMLKPIKIQGIVDIHYIYRGQPIGNYNAESEASDAFNLSNYVDFSKGVAKGLSNPGQYQVINIENNNQSTFGNGKRDIYVNLTQASPNKYGIINIRYIYNNQQIGSYQTKGKSTDAFNLNNYVDLDNGVADGLKGPKQYRVSNITNSGISNFGTGTQDIDVYLTKVPNSNNNHNNHNNSDQSKGTVDIHYIYNGQPIGSYSAKGNSNDPFNLSTYVNFNKGLADGLANPSQYQVDNVSGEKNLTTFGHGVHDIYINLSKARNSQDVTADIVYRDISDNEDVQPSIPLSGAPGKRIAEKYYDATNSDSIPKGYHYEGMGPHGDLELKSGEQYVINVERNDYNISVQYVDPNGRHVEKPIQLRNKYNTPFNITPYENSDVPPNMKFDKVLQGNNIKTFGPAANNPSHNLVVIQVDPKNVKGSINIRYVDPQGKQIGTTSDVVEPVGNSFNINDYTSNVSNVLPGYHYDGIVQGAQIKSFTGRPQDLVIKVAKDSPKAGTINIHYMDKTGDRQIGFYSVTQNVGNHFNLSDYVNIPQGLAKGLNADLKQYRFDSLRGDDTSTFDPGTNDIYVYLDKVAPKQTKGTVDIHYMNNGRQIGFHQVQGNTGDPFNLNNYENTNDGMPDPTKYHITNIEGNINKISQGTTDVYVDLVTEPSDNTKDRGLVDIHYDYDGQQIGYYQASGKSSDVFNLSNYENAADGMPNLNDYKIVDVDDNGIKTFGHGVHDVYVLLDKRLVDTEGTINVKYVNNNGVKIDSDSWTEDTGRPFDLSFYKTNIPSGYRFVSVIEGNNVNKFNGGTQDVVIKIQKLSLTDEGIINVQYVDQNGHPVSKLHTIIENTGNHFDLPYYEENVPANYHFVKVLNGGQVNTFNKGVQDVKIEVASDSYVNPSDSDAAMDVVYKDISDSDVVSNHLVSGANGMAINRDNYKRYIPSDYHFVKYGYFDNVLKNGDHNVIYVQNNNQPNRNSDNDKVTINIVYKDKNGTILNTIPVSGVNGQLVDYQYYETHDIPSGYTFSGKVDGYSTFRQGDDDVIYVDKPNNGNNTNPNNGGSGNNTNPNNPNDNGGNQNGNNTNPNNGNGGSNQPITPNKNNGNNTNPNNGNNNGGNGDNTNPTNPNDNGGNQGNGNGTNPNNGNGGDNHYNGGNQNNNGNNSDINPNNGARDDIPSDSGNGDNNLANDYNSRINGNSQSNSNNGEMPQTGESTAGRKNENVGKILITLASALGALGVVIDRRRRSDN